MRKSKAVSTVLATVKQYKDDRKRLAKELKRHVRDGQRAGDVLLTGAAYCYLAENRYFCGDLDGLLTDALKAEALLKDTGAYGLIAKANICLSLAYIMQENDQMALMSSERAYRIVRKHRIQGETRVDALNVLATSHHCIGDYRTSIKRQAECVALIGDSAPDNLASRAKYTLNLAECYKDNGEPEKAGEVLASMAGWIERVDYQAVVCDYHLRRAIIAYTLGDREKGDAFTDRALGLVPKDVYPHPVYDDLRQVSQILTQSGDRDRAERIFRLMTSMPRRIRAPSSSSSPIAPWRTTTTASAITRAPRRATSGWRRSTTGARAS